MAIFDLNQPAVSVSESSINSTDRLAVAVYDDSGNVSGAVCDNSGSSYSDSSSKHSEDDNASCEFNFDF